jgi:hypothetical protein
MRQLQRTGKCNISSPPTTLFSTKELSTTVTNPGADPNSRLKNHFALVQTRNPKDTFTLSWHILNFILNLETWYTFLSLHPGSSNKAMFPWRVAIIYLIQGSCALGSDDHLLISFVLNKVDCLQASGSTLCFQSNLLYKVLIGSTTKLVPLSKQSFQVPWQIMWSSLLG